MRILPVLACLILGLCAPRCGAIGVETLFQIGNSLTWDSQPNATMEMAQSAGQSLDIGYHIRSGAWLLEIWGNPEPNNNIDPTEYGYYPEALPNYDWDALAFQPHEENGSTFDFDLQAVHNFVELAESQGRNTDSAIYIYAAWPPSDSWSGWHAELGEPVTQRTFYREAYYELLVGTLRETYGDRVMLIPTGHVFAELESLLQDEPYYGLNHIQDFYRDSLHMNDLGRFVASTSVFATVTGESPIGLPVPTQLDANEIPAELVEPLQKLVWQVVTRNRLNDVEGKRSGDFNGDNVVDLLDHAIWEAESADFPLRSDANDDLRVDDLDLSDWRANISPEELADFDQDGEVTSADYALWKSEFGVVGYSTADGNVDGIVDMADYVVWQAGVDAMTQRPGDYDLDGLIGSSDYEIWQSEVGASGDSPADGNGDGVVDTADYVLWRNELSTPPRVAGDFNGDGVIDRADLDVWYAENGTVASILADANDDRVVDEADLAIWSLYTSEPLPAGATGAAAPEPAGFALVAAVVGAGCFCRRRRPA